MGVSIQKLVGAGTVAFLCSSIIPAMAEDLDIVVKTAPIVPHGLLVGQPMDITMSFADLNPMVAGLDLKKGGTAKVYLPAEVANLGFPVSKLGEAEGCEPPVLAKCSSGGFLDGWPQSPLLPLNAISYDESDHSLTLTAVADSPPYSVGSPGAKLIHLFTFGFQNPDKAGGYPLRLEIQPDPDKPVVFSGDATLNVSADMESNLSVDSTQAPHITGPRYENTMYQWLRPGDTSRTMSLNMWDADHKPISGASISMVSETNGDLVADDGTTIGHVTIEAPDKAKGFVLMSAPSFAANTGLAGYPTGRLVMSLRTARGVKGEYKVSVALGEGDPVVYQITTE